MTRFSGSFVIGGTGMLSGAARWLIEASERTLLVARRASAFLPNCASVTALDLDWSGPNFEREVVGALGRWGAVETALLWLHEPVPTLNWLLPELGAARVVLVLGSLDGRPKVPAGWDRLTTVRLGSVETPHGRRWLTHDEISAGAIASLEDGGSRTVGELGPWP
jgi:hypothetical protein